MFSKRHLKELMVFRNALSDGTDGNTKRRNKDYNLVPVNATIDAEKFATLNTQLTLKRNQVMHGTLPSSQSHYASHYFPAFNATMNPRVGNYPPFNAVVTGGGEGTYGAYMSHQPLLQQSGHYRSKGDTNSIIEKLKKTNPSFMAQTMGEKSSSESLNGQSETRKSILEQLEQKIKQKSVYKRPTRDSSSESSLDEAPPTKKFVTTKPVPKQIKTAGKPQEDSSSDSSSDEAPTAKKVVPAKTIPQKATPAKKPAEDSSSDSSSDEAPAAKKVVPAKTIPQKATPAKKPAEDSSSDEAPAVAKKVVPAKTVPQKATPAKKPAEDSSSDSSSDEAPAAKKVVLAKTIPQKATPAKKPAEDSSSDETPAVAKKLLPAKTVPQKATPPKKTVEDSSSDSSSDEAPAAKKFVPAKMVPQKATPAKKPAEDSSSDEAPAVAKTVVPAKTVPQKTTPARKPAEDSSSDEAPVRKTVQPAKILPQKRILAKKPAEDSSSNSSSDEAPSAKKPVPAKTVSQKAILVKQTAKDSSSSDEAPTTAKKVLFAESVLHNASTAKNPVDNSSSDSSTHARLTKRIHSIKNSDFSDPVSSPLSDDIQSSVYAPNSTVTDTQNPTHFKSPSKPVIDSNQSKNSRKSVNFPSGVKRTFSDDSGIESANLNNQNPNHSTSKRVRRSLPTPFRRVKDDEIAVNPNLCDNSYEAKIGARGSWGEKANNILKHTQGKSFRHEKTKKKRGTYSGGIISTDVCSYKFED
ncbi:hypothetical protein Ciccas_000087 [Cichlidogyrus casuarinus]|uniref:Srp40 C-terminal domain-containing protein n=1 Tax=Cichlidogyrus casuarinus TaxID=1844966 RepID=A0ABD2QNV7_9PLAT